MATRTSLSDSSEIYDFWIAEHLASACVARKTNIKISRAKDCNDVRTFVLLFWIQMLPKDPAGTCAARKTEIRIGRTKSHQDLSKGQRKTEIQTLHAESRQHLSNHCFATTTNVIYAGIRNFPTIQSVPSRSPLSTSRESHRRALRVHSIRYEMFKCIFQITHYHYVFWLRNVINVLELLFQSVAPKIRNK